MKISIPQSFTFFPLVGGHTILESVWPHLHFLVAHGTFKYHEKHFLQCLSHLGGSFVVSFFSFAMSSKSPSHVLSLQNCFEDGTLKIRKQLSHFFLEIGAFLFWILPSWTSMVIVVGRLRREVFLEL